MNLFYSPDIKGDYCFLSEEESRHCRNVLRSVNGDIIYLTDGKGTLFQARIIDAGSRQVSFEILSREENYGKRDYHLHLAVAPTKNIERFEWFLEKATEIGIDEITPLICKHSERRQLRTDRLNKVITAAVKQSLKAYHPKLHNALDFTTFIEERRAGQVFIAHLDDRDPLLLQKACRKDLDTTILVGPEGDFSEKELSMACDAGYQMISLGNSRLRTETAAVAACLTVRILNQ